MADQEEPEERRKTLVLESDLKDASVKAKRGFLLIGREYKREQNFKDNIFFAFDSSEEVN